MVISVTGFHDFCRTKPRFELRIACDLLRGDPNNGICGITGGEIAGNMFQFFEIHRVDGTGVNSESQGNNHAVIRKTIKHCVNLFRESPGIDLPVADCPQTRLRCDAALSAAVGFGTVEIGLIYGEAFGKTVVQFMQKLTSAGTAGIVAAGRGDIVGSLPVGVSEPVERCPVVIGEIPTVVRNPDKAVFVKFGAAGIFDGENGSLLTVKSGIFGIRTGDFIRPDTCFCWSETDTEFVSAVPEAVEGNSCTVFVGENGIQCYIPVGIDVFPAACQENVCPFPDLCLILIFHENLSFR